jgi:hypothetical protein
MGKWVVRKTHSLRTISNIKTTTKISSTYQEAFLVYYNDKRQALKITRTHSNFLTKTHSNIVLKQISLPTFQTQAYQL